MTRVSTMRRAAVLRAGHAAVSRSTPLAMQPPVSLRSGKVHTKKGIPMKKIIASPRRRRHRGSGCNTDLGSVATSPPPAAPSPPAPKKPRTRSPPGRRGPSGQDHDGSSGPGPRAGQRRRARDGRRHAIAQRPRPTCDKGSGHRTDLAVQEAARLELQTHLVADAGDAGDIERLSATSAWQSCRGRW